MPNEIMYQSSDTYVVLETDQPEQFLSATELLDKLKHSLMHLAVPLHPDLQKFGSLDLQAKHLLENGCELEVSPDCYLQWYVVRLEK